MFISSVADAVAAAQYLSDRKVLCDKCGLQLARHFNQFNARCVDCLPKHGEFKETENCNEFEKSLCRALRSYVLQAQDAGGKILGEGGQVR